MRKESLTPAERQQMIAYRDEWLQHQFTRNGQIDQPAFEEGITWVYENYLGKPTPQITYADSWPAAVMQIQRLKSAHEPGVGDNPGANMRAKLGEKLTTKLTARLGENLRLNLDKNLWANLWNSLGDKLGDDLRNNVLSTLGDNLQNDLLTTFNEFSFRVRLDEAGLYAFYEFGMRLTEQQDAPLYADLQRYIQLIRSGVFVTYLYENLVVAVPPPTQVHRNSAGRLHNLSGPALAFLDGQNYYYINGRSVDADLIEQPELITKERFLSERNGDVRGAMY